jgi:hypothetical protein
MSRRPVRLLAATGALLALAAVPARATTMSSHLGARLSGMGVHGVVNLTASHDKLCWKFDAPALKGATRATIHAGKRSAVLAELGMRYAKSGCTKVSAMTLEHLTAKPASYSVWVATKAHPAELRGTLRAGMAHM